jgi:hypothetical protein
MPVKMRVLAMLAALGCASACADSLLSQPEDFAADPDAANASEHRATYAYAESAPAIGIHATPVVGGKESAPCAWPSTVDVSGCTATLIHPRVVTTAAHCLGRSGSARVTFTDGEGKPGSFTVMATCTAGARGGRGGVGPRDWAYCVLPEDERVKQIPFTPPLVGCEAERYLKEGGTAWVVGFGATGGQANDYGPKREVEVKINKVGDGIIDVGDREAGACYGDSGGPLYVKVSDGTHDWGWRVAGSTSGAGGPCDCTCSTVYTDVRSHIEALEEMEDFDVTPCTDDAGNWAPGPDCKDLITNPGMATGTYPSCTVQRTTEPIASCGTPSGAAGAAGGAAGAAAGAAGVGAAGSSAAGSGAVAAAGSGGAAAGAAGSAAGSVAGGAAMTAAPTAGVGATGRGVGVAGAGASAGGPAFGSAGATGSQTNPASAAGAVGVATGAQTSTESESGGCQAANVGAGQARAFGLFSALLLGLSARSFRSRRRPRAARTS